MTYIDTQVVKLQQIKITNHLNELGIFKIRKEIIDGLKSEKKNISSKYFYDKNGSKLFEKITKLPEYYPTRTEKEILHKIAPGLMGGIQNIDIVELGSGDCSKIKVLLNSVSKEHLNSIRYFPADISKSAIYESAQELIERYPNLQVNGLVVDFINQLDVIPSEKKRLFILLGSTLGNFNNNIANQFLKNLSSSMNYGDNFLLGIDLVKPTTILHAAYNDSQNVTAKFNINILNVINDIIDSDFNPNDFDHKAFYNHKESRIEMHLVARSDISISSPYSSKNIDILKNEPIHTENSHKYSFDNIADFQKITKLKIKDIYTDKNDWFALILFEK